MGGRWQWFLWSHVAEGCLHIEISFLSSSIHFTNLFDYFEEEKKNSLKALGSLSNGRLGMLQTITHAILDKEKEEEYEHADVRGSVKMTYIHEKENLEENL